MSHRSEDRKEQKDEQKERDDEEHEAENASGKSYAAAQSTSEWLSQLLGQTLSVQDKPTQEQVLPDLNLEGVARYIKEGNCRNIVTMAGAGISTSAGIPDFRSPESGLYHNLQKYNLPNPQAIFSIEFFKENPKPFFSLARELYPGSFKPSLCHYFVRLLDEKNLLLRHYTQNIDTLERVAGMVGERIVEAHGTFHSAHCIACKEDFTQQWVKERIFADEIPKCTLCDGLVKPDIVFFGESLPAKFFECSSEDLPKCDLLIIMGTSLVVHPFASLANRVPSTTPRLYINMEKTEGGNDPMMALLGMGHGFRFDQPDNYRDVFWQGTCDDGCQALADKLGWGEELTSLVAAEHARIAVEEKPTDTEKP